MGCVRTRVGLRTKCTGQESSPAGAKELSPALQRWVRRKIRIEPRRDGTKGAGFSRAKLGNIEFG